jgi:DNA modification methylase
MEVSHKIHNANIKEWAANYQGELFDGILCDPPYELGFMGKSWDSSGIAFDVDMWADIYKLLKPGAHLLAFSGSRTYHRMAVAIEDAGFEIRDMIEWVYGSGFPKSLNIGKAVDKINGEDGRPLKFVEWYRTTGMKQKQTNEIIGKTDVGSHYLRKDQPVIPTAELWQILRPHISVEIPKWVDELVDRIERERELIGKHETDMGGLGGERLGQKGGDITKGTSEWEGYGTALKPAHEPCVLARKPLEKGMTVATNVLKHGTGGLNIDGTRVGTTENLNGGAYSKGDYDTTGKTYELGLKRQEGNYSQPIGRFPANLIHDGSDEVEAVFPQTGKSKAGGRSTGVNFGGNGTKDRERTGHNDNGGSASRFFYTAKASKSERNAGLEGFEPKREADRVRDDGVGGDNPRNRSNNAKVNHHPTVKPLSLTKYLATLIKPPTGGRLLVPFSGSGSEMIGALQAGWEYVEGVELTEEYIPIAEARIKYWLSQKEAEDKQPKQAVLV